MKIVKKGAGLREEKKKKKEGHQERSGHMVRPGLFCAATCCSFFGKQWFVSGGLGNHKKGKRRKTGGTKQVRTFGLSPSPYKKHAAPTRMSGGGNGRRKKKGYRDEALVGLLPVNRLRFLPLRDPLTGEDCPQRGRQ